MSSCVTSTQFCAPLQHGVARVYGPHITANQPAATRALIQVQWGYTTA